MLIVFLYLYQKLLPNFIFGYSESKQSKFFIVNKDLIIDVESQEVSIALLEDKVLTELHKEKRDNNYSVGDL